MQATTRRLENLLGATSVGVVDLLNRIGEDLTGMGGGAAAAIVTIGTRPGRPIEELRASVGISHSGAVRLVARLEERGWVERGRSVDRRRVRLLLTPAGRRLFGTLLDERDRALGALLEPLEPAFASALDEILTTVLARLEEAAEGGGAICRLCDPGACVGARCPGTREVTLEGGASGS